MKLPHLFLLLAAVTPWAAGGTQPFYDRKHFSKILGEERNYRILLPPDYETSAKRYPVVYYFHGHSDRYTLEKYDGGKDTIPQMADFVAHHDVIVVSVDGYVARDYTGFYGGTPWDVMREGGDYDFGEYFKELAAHIDASYRTLTDRRHRATSGLSMGGFMSLWLSARYPQWIGSASSFNPGPEFYVGDKGRRVLWRPKDHVENHTRTMVRLIRASGDYISQYHEETRDAYARAHDVDFEFRQDEYHRHWATSIGETLEFHMRAFADPALDNAPETWSHDDPYRSFEVWGYKVETAGDDPGFTCLSDVSQAGLRVATRRWAPDGPPVKNRRISITTAALYQPGASYQWIDYNFATGDTRREAIRAGADGKLVVTVDGGGHQISFSGPGAGEQPPVLLPVTSKDRLRVEPARDVALPVRIYNPRVQAMTNVHVALSSAYPTVDIVAGSSDIPKIDSGTAIEVPLRARFAAGAGYFAPARLELAMTYDGWHTVSADVDVLIVPEIVPAPVAVEVVDGRTLTLPVFRQKGNQGGGGSVQRTITEGKGNGNGALEPGEEATVWVKMPQGMDPFDKNNWYRAKIYTDSPWVTEVADLEEQKQLEWTSGMERTSVIRLSPDAPHGAVIPLLLDNESWSFCYTPDVRYGKEDLYQAFQLHTHHLHRWELKVR
ncbi:MAG TPA: alpha/beta hydrolase-fold protein [Bryobacteraceae bacterium]|nr:alpha/beta hydrolase-fold protein [Bryobacteraceae bacterium]